MGQLVGLSNKNQGKLTTIQEKNVYKRTIPQPMEDKGNFFISKTGEGSIFKEKRKQDSGLKTLGSTLADIGLEAGEGITSVIENLIAKPLMRGVSNVIKTSGIAKLSPEYEKLKTQFGVDLGEVISKSLDESLDQDISKIAFGKDKEGQEKLKQSYEIAKKYANIPSFLDPTNRTIDANARQGIEESSVLGEGGDAIVQGAAQSLMIGGAGAGLTKGVTGALTNAGVNVTKGLTKAVQGASTFATSGVNSFNSKLSEMHREGYDDRTSLIVAGKTGLFEGLTELIGAGIPGLNTSGAFDVVEDRLGKALTKKFNSNIGKLAVGVLKAGEEASEEFFNNFFNTVSDYILYDLDKNYTYDKENKTGNIIEDLKNQKTLEQMLYAGITAGISSGSVSISNVINKNSVIKAYAKDNNVDFNTAKKQIDEYANKYAENQKNEDTKYMDLRQEGENIALNEARKGRLQSLVEKQYQENNNINNGLLPTQEEFNQIRGNYVYTKSDNVKIDNLRKDASTYLKEGEKTTNFIKTLEKIVNDKDIEIRFDDKLGNNVNGTYKNGVITINPNSNRAGEFVAIHELTHAIGTKPMIDMIQTYRKSNAEFNQAVERLLSTYNTTEINEEALGDIAGQLFGNQEYINNLSMEKPNLFKRIYNEIKYLWHQFTGYKNQNQFIEDLKNKWESAYRNSKAKQTNKIGYSINGDGRDFFYRGQQKEGTDLSYNDTQFQGSEDDGYYFTPNKKTANKYGKNIIERFRDENNTVTVEEADRLQEMATKKLEEHMKEGKWYEEDDLLEQMTLGRSKAFAEYTGKPFVETGDMFGEDAEAVYYPEFDKDTKYSIEEVKKEPIKDNQGRELSKQQQEYFKNSKARDENGNLKVAYHNTTDAVKQFNIFDSRKYYNNYNEDNIIWFTDNEDVASSYSDGEYEIATSKNKSNKKNKYQYQVYLDIKNPFVVDVKGRNYTQALLDSENSIVYSSEGVVDLVLEKNKNGSNYDGIIFKNIIDYNDDYEGTRTPHDDYVVFNSNQIKNVDNLNPTEDPDIRYSKDNKTWREYLEKEFPNQGTRTNLQGINERNKPKQENKTTQQEKPQEKAKNDVKKENKILNESKKDDVLEVTPEQRKEHAKLFKTKGDEKIRKFVDSAVNSDAVDGLVDFGDLDVEKITYEPISNKKTLANANNKLDILGYEEALKYISGRFNDDTATLDDIALAERLIQESAKRKDAQVTSDLIISTAMLGTELGQKVQALSMIRRLTPEGQLKALNRVITKNKASNNANIRETWKDVELTDEMMKEILDAYDKDGNYNQEDLNERVEKVKQQISEKLKVSVFDKMNSWRYLAMLGNPKTHIRNVVSNVAMRMAIKVKNAMARTLEDVLPIQNKTKTWKKSTQFVKDFAKTTTKEMKAEITGEGKFNETTEIEKQKKIFKSKLMNKLSDLNSNLLEGEDWFFSSRAFEDTFREYLTANGIETQQDIDNNPEIVQKGINYSVEQAQIATFRQYSKLASIINNAEKKSKVAKVIIESVLPFKKTPINVAKAGISYSPLGLAKSLSYDIYRVKTGQIEASQLIDNISQGLTGTALTLIGYALAKAGILKASGGDDKEEKYDEALGNSAYSIKIGDKNYSLSWLSPVAMPLFVGAEAHRVFEEKEGWDMNIVADSLAETLDPLNEMSFMQGITSALDGYAKGTGHLGDIAKNSAQSYILQFFPTLFSQFASLMDDKKRSTRADKTADWVFGDETIRKIMYKIPGLRNQLEVATDIWGNEKEQADNIIERAFDVFINPASSNKDISTKLDSELKRVYEETDESGVIPSVPYGYVNSNGEKIVMTAEQYTKYKKEYGQTAYKYLDKMINTSQYKSLTDEEKASVIKEVFAYSKAKSNKDILDIDMDKKYTKANIIADYPMYKMYQERISSIKEKYSTTNSEEKATMTNKRKEEVVKYINSLPLNSQKKLMLYKIAGGYSIKDNKAYLYDYINKQNMTKQEKESLWKTLFE